MSTMQDANLEHETNAEQAFHQLNRYDRADGVREVGGGRSGMVYRGARGVERAVLAMVPELRTPVSQELQQYSAGMDAPAYTDQAPQVAAYEREKQDMIASSLQAANAHATASSTVAPEYGIQPNVPTQPTPVDTQFGLTPDVQDALNNRYRYN